jgi:16S rRNA (cytidine1402-2'-O)-methyltransferase
LSVRYVGTLYLVSTPIGNLEDITLRAVRILQEVSLIAAEDTRRAAILAARYGIRTPITSYFEGNKLAKMEHVLDAVSSGDVALISEAGTPGLSDPGFELIRAAIDCDIPVVPIPGPSAPVTALVISGLPTDSFVYLGFLPRRNKDRRQLLTVRSTETRTLVAFEAPHRLRGSLADAEAILGDRPVAVCRELTKLHEEVIRGRLSEVRTHFDAVAPRGEFTLVIGGASAEAGRWDRAEVQRALDDLLAQGTPRPEAARQLAPVCGWRRSEIYKLGLDAD